MRFNYINIFVTFLSLFSINLYSQNLEDLKRLLDNNNLGTARFTSMGGAFMSLGGDLSSISHNPASSSVFNHANVSFSLNYSAKKNELVYGESVFDNTSSDFDINQFGVVFVLKEANTEKNWSQISFAFNYNTNNNYKNNFFVSTKNSNQHIGDYFLYYAQGLELNNLVLLENETIRDLYQYLGQTNNLGFGAQQAFLGYQSYIINPISSDESNKTYVSNAKIGGPLDNEYYFTSSGFNKKYTYNISSRYKDNIYFGLNINHYKINYDEIRDFYESGYDFDSNLQKVRFRNKLVSYGKGTSLQFGIIGKINNQIRFGLSYHSPTWYKFFDETSQFLISDHFNNGQSFRDTIDPDTVNVFPEYKITTPSKVGFGISLVGENGLLSIEYNSSKISSSIFKDQFADSFLQLNNNIKREFKSLNNFKLGGELRLLPISLRAGYIIKSTYSKIYDNSSNILSLGFGLNFSSSLLDFSAQFGKVRDVNNIFSYGIIDNIRSKNSLFNLIATYTVKL